MRGLLFTGGMMPDMGAARHLFGNYSFVVAADSGLEGADAAGIVPDVITGDMDSLRDISLLDRYPQSRKEIWPKDKDFTDTELALAVMKDAGVDDVVLIGGAGGRMDHLFALKALFDGEYPPALWIGEESVVAGVGYGFPSACVRVSGLSAEDPVSVFSAGTGQRNCAGTGFVWDLSLVDWKSGGYSLSNRAASGSCELAALEGRFLFIVPLSHRVEICRLRTGLN